MPGIELISFWPVIPFGEEGAASGDVGITVAAVIDDDVDAAAFGLPLLNDGQPGQFLATAVVGLVGMSVGQETADADGANGFAEDAQKGANLVRIQ